MRNAIVLGFDYYGDFLSKLINEESSNWRLRYYPSTRVGTMRALLATASADAVISFGGPGPNMALVEAARRRNIPVIVIWAGTDVLTTQKQPQLLEIIKQYGFINVCDGPWLVDELRELGIEATYVPVTGIRPAEKISPLPKAFRVLTYLPEPRRTFYGEKTIYALAREFPDIPFRVVGRGGRNPIAPRNVEFLGHVHDMHRHIDESVVLIRLPEHDGKSMLVLEALARGRHVIWNYDFPTVHHAPRTHDVSRILRGLYSAHERGVLEPNHTGYKYAAENFTRAQLAAGFETVLNNATATRVVRERAHRKVAISGLPMVCAQVGEELMRGNYGWKPEYLRASVRLEVATSLIKLLSCDVWYSVGSPIGDRWLHLLAKLLRKPRVIHWVGTDITSLYSDKRLRRFCESPRVQNLAEVDWTIDELCRLGVQASLAPLPPRLPAHTTMPLPERFTVLLYLPQTRGDFYGRREYERLIRAYSKRNVRFIVVGGGDFYAPPDADVVRMGWCSSLDQVYRDTTVLIRFTKHDGLSLMTLESLTHGRYVLWSEDFPFTMHVRNYDDIERTLSELLERFERGDLPVQTDAARYVAETYAPARCVARLTDSWNRAIEPRAGGALAMESPQ